MARGVPGAALPAAVPVTEPLKPAQLPLPLQLLAETPQPVVLLFRSTKAETADMFAVVYVVLPISPLAYSDAWPCTSC
jgi:hypothetical protein